MLRQGSQLPELQSDSAHAPRLVLYQQTHHTPSGEPISILPLIQNNTGVTHLYIAAVHLNEPPGNITLNEHRPDDPRYDQLWREVRQLQEAGVKVMIMLGGAARGSFQRLDGSQAQFNLQYLALHRLISTRNLDGIDLDIEEPFTLPSLAALIRCLKADFGTEFIITLAPVAPALLPLKPYLTSLVRRLLNPPPNDSQYRSLPAILRAFLKPGILKTRSHLSGFNHLELESSDVGKLVSWYNVQFYNGWGDASTTQLYDLIIGTGWNPQRIVLGVLTNPGNGGGFVDLARLRSVVEGLSQRYGNDFGGVMGWEYFNATSEGLREPWEWVKGLGSVYLRSSVSDATVQQGRSTAAPGEVASQLRDLHIPGNVTTTETEAVHGHQQAPVGERVETGAGQLFPEEHITRLTELGFERPEAIAALEAMGGDVDAAAALLFGE